MRKLIVTSALFVALSFGTFTVCTAQDSGGAIVRPGAAAQTAPQSDPLALNVLAQAAAEQGGKALATPGALKSFRIEFGNVKVTQMVVQKDGSTLATEVPASALEIDWMRNEGKPSSLKTHWRIDGKDLTHCVMGDEDYYWLYDSETVTQLQESTHADDVQLIHRHRRLAETLLDVAILHKLLNDGSVWRQLDDPLHAGVALHRTPPEGGNGLTFTLWIDPETSQVTHVRVLPIEKGASVLHYELAYMKDRPEVTGADLSFPQHVIVHEQRPQDSAPKKVMELYLRRVYFNSDKVNADTFSPPKKDDRR